MRNIRAPKGRWLLVTARPLRNEQGQIRGGVSIYRDVTDRKTVERQMIEAVDREKRRIGQDLHDSLGQQLTGVAYRLAALTELLEDRSKRRMGDELVLLVDEAIGQTRSLAKGLHPVAAGPLGFTNALESLGVRVRALGVACRVTCQDGVYVADGVATDLFRIAEEAVTNALRHAKPTLVRIDLARSRSGMRLEISNTGRRSKRKRSAGMGEKIMRYRADSIGAQVTVVALASGGTIVRCDIPVAAQASSSSGRKA